MIKRTLTMLIAAAIVAAACGDDDATSTTTEAPTTSAASTTTSTSVPIEEIHLRWEFSEALDGWTVGFADYSVAHEPMDVGSGIEPLPPGLEEPGNGLMVTGSNTSDDLFMFLSRAVGPDSGLQPDTAYRADLRFAVASGAPSNCVGIGGAPGESVFVKAGVVPTEPEIELIDGDYRLDLDKGNQSSGGADVAVIGDVANGLDCEEALSTEPRPYRTLTFDYETRVTTNSDGTIWVVVGTDSGFEGITTLFYRWVELDLTPSSQSS